MVAQDMALAPSFRVGAVVGTALKIWLKNLVFFGAVGIVVHVPGMILDLAFPRQTDVTTSAFARLPPSTFCNLVFVQLATAIVCYGVLQQLRGRSIDYGACLRIGLGRFFPALVTAVLALILIVLGMLLLFIPGLIVGVMLWVALPVCVAENLGPVASLKRSASLTKGYRWSIFGIAILLAVISIVGGFVVGGVAGFFIGLSHVPLHPALTVLQLVVAALVGSLTAVLATCAYYYLRTVKEGVDIDHIVAVFE